MRTLPLLVVLAACSPDPIELPGGDGVLGGNVCELDKYGPELEYIYVVNRGSDTVTVLNPRSCTTFLDLPTGPTPVVANATATGAHVYVVNQGDASVTVIDTEENEVVDTLQVGQEPDWIRFDIPHLNLWTAARDGIVSLIDVIERDVVAQVQVDPGSHRIVMSETLPFTAWITNEDTHRIHAFDSESLELLGAFDVGDDPADLDWARWSDQLYVCSGGAQPGIDVVATHGPAAYTVVERIPLSSPCTSVEFDPTGRWGFVLRHDGTTLTVIDADTDAVHVELEVGEGPDQVAFHDETVLVSGLRSADLTFVDLQTFEVVDRIQTGDPAMVDEPRYRQLRRSLGDPDVFYLVNPYENNVLLYDMAERAVRGVVEVGDDPGELMIGGPIGGSCC